MVSLAKTHGSVIHNEIFMGTLLDENPTNHVGYPLNIAELIDISLHYLLYDKWI